MKKAKSAAKPKVRAKAKAKPKPKTKPPGAAAYSWPRRISQTQLAQAVGVARSTVQAWDCPRNQDATFDLPAVIAWRVEREADRARAAVLAAGAGTDEDGAPLSPEKRKTLAQAQIEEMKLAAMQRRFVPVEEYEVLLGGFVDGLRRAGTLLQKRWGHEAWRILDDALSEAEQALHSGMAAQTEGEEAETEPEEGEIDETKS